MSFFSMELVTPLLVLGVDVLEKIIQVIFSEHIKELLDFESVGAVGVELYEDAGETTA